MIRQMVKINEELCNGCGLCATACHEGAIGIIDGKAKILNDEYCDGLGNCLPVCPTDAIKFETREAVPFVDPTKKQPKHEAFEMESQLSNWPIQLKLLPVNAPSFDRADLIISADCCAFTYGNFHNEFIKGKMTIIACPKLDAVDYSDKLSEIFKTNNINSLTVTRMEVPCCGGLEFAVKEAIKKSGKDIPLEVVTISIKGEIRN